jgi:arylsulfatase A-like enzyme
MPDGTAAPNVLFVVLDTVRKDHLTPYGYDRETTPTLEHFAEEATVFENAVAPAPWTLPVHASLFTGLYPSEHGACQETPYLEDATTLAETLGDAGYRSACFSSNAWITPYTRLTAGFDEQDNFFQVMPGDFLSGPLARAWQGMNDNPYLRSVADRLVEVGNRFHEYFAGGEGSDSKTPRVIDQTIEFIERADEAGEPFFSFINLMDAHLPYHPPEETAERFAPGVDSASVCQNSKEFNCGARDIDEAEWTDIKNLYDAEIRHLDDQLGRLFTWLREAELWEETVVVVCADHGELHGEHDLYGHEFGLYDPIVNVPLMIKHPDLDADREARTVELLDCYHTLRDHTGTTGAGFDPARSVLRADYRDFATADGDSGRDDRASADTAGTEGPRFEREDVAFVEYSRPIVELNQLETKASAAGIELSRDSRFYSRMRAARTPEEKYVRNERIPDECYWLDADPDELDDRVGTDRCGDLDGILADFEDAMGHWDGADEDRGRGEEALGDMDDTTKDRLRDLGYIE